jgi:hypothetical protein
MKSRTWVWTLVVCLFTALAMPVWTGAQDNQSNNKHQKYAVDKLPGPYMGTRWATTRVLLVPLTRASTTEAAMSVTR